MDLLVAWGALEKISITHHWLAVDEIRASSRRTLADDVRGQDSCSGGIPDLGRSGIHVSLENL